MRKPIGLAMMGASLLLIVLAACASGSGAAQEAAPAITPNFTRLAGPAPAAPPTLVAGPVAAAPTARSVVAATAAPVVSTDQVKRITPAGLQKRLAESNPPLVWELRSPDRYEQGHIPGSQLVGVREVAALAEKLDRGQAIVTSCD